MARNKILEDEAIQKRIMESNYETMKKLESKRKTVDKINMEYFDHLNSYFYPVEPYCKDKATKSVMDLCRMLCFEQFMWISSALDEPELIKVFDRMKDWIHHAR